MTTLATRGGFMNRNLRVVPAALWIAAMTGATFAADLPKEGTFDITACQVRVLNRVEISTSRSMSSYEQTGTSLSNPPGGLFDTGSNRCVGTATAIKGQIVEDISFCITAFPDGGWIHRKFTRQPDGTYTWDLVEATGRYEGIKLDGKATTITGFPMLKPDVALFCNRQTGTYKLK
jgi:hypothetical protein